MTHLEALRTARRSFARCAKFEREFDRARIRDAIYFAGGQWHQRPTVEEILSALDFAGFKIVRKARPRTCEDTR